MTNEAIQTIAIVGSAIGALVMATGGIVAAVMLEGTRTRRELWGGIAALSNTITIKFDNHEKKDDRRFADMSDDIWEIRCRNAAKDGDPPPLRSPRRLITVEDDG